MVTDDERRAVAEGLRDEVGCGSSWPGMERLGLILGIKREPRTGLEGRILTRLADLIYPGDMSQGRRDIVACDREALLEEAKELEKCAWYFGLDFDEDEPLRDRLKEASEAFAGSARRIREALGVQDA